MTARDYDKRIVEALNGTSEDRHTKRVQEALAGDEYLYGLDEPEADYDDAVRSWAAKESLRGAAERYARSGSTRLSDLHMEQIVGEVYEATNPGWSGLERLERTAVALNRMGAQMEGISKS